VRTATGLEPVACVLLMGIIVQPGAKGMTDWNDRILLDLLKMAATPIDFDQLIADRILRRHGARYEFLDLQ
jgi:hypothetical protein